MLVVEFSITPIVGDELSPYIDAAVDVVKQSGLKYEVEPMGTTIEGELDQVLEVVTRAHKAVRDKGADRIVTEIKIDDRKEGVTIEREVGSYRASA